MTPLVQIEDLNIQFTGGKKPVQAVSGVSLSVRPGEAVALIGESGSGKSVTLRTLLRLHPYYRGPHTHAIDTEAAALTTRIAADAGHPQEAS